MKETAVSQSSSQFQSFPHVSFAVQHLRGDVTVLSVSGELDMLTAPRLGEAITQARADGPHVLITDLTEVAFLASPGLTVLIEGHVDTPENSRFGVVAVGAALRSLEMTGVCEVVPVFRDVPSAIETLEPRSKQKDASPAA
ncbi:STAS domain-containing protein [Fodinicola feengrottensis]|uniref:STAS domain-containing protein n=1 Tax=Fodinicola feengrottensis TaxID=435914 RepID=A0ABN2GK74_9ACTN|nr:STAS domain-containing protein [Fodinicola feengrottensis]